MSYHNLKCSPHITDDNISCIMLNLLVEMANAYNETHPDNQIKLNPNDEILNTTEYKTYLIKEFEHKLKDKCSDQKCWLTQPFIAKMKNDAREELLKYTFRPEGPSGKFDWLSTFNIDDVMQQYEKKYKDFKFLGAVPLDFDKHKIFGIKDIDYKKLFKQGKTKIGIVFNLDKYGEPGSHWVSMYSDLKNGEINFFDSYGVYPKDEIQAFMRRHEKFCKDVLGIKDVYVKYNKKIHQKKNSECGVYSTNFILRRLRGDSFDKVCDSQIEDDVIRKCRRKYFN